MYGKGVSEIIRHYKRPKHFRRDQRWRYEHLRHVDPVSGKTKYSVQCSTGKFLTDVELEKEKKSFTSAELVTL